MNTKTGHTPGPWVYRFRSNGVTVETEECETPIALVNPTVGRGNVDADARLISAAPGLLDACKMLVLLDSTREIDCGNCNTPKAIGCIPGCPVGLAKNAIAKAEGTNA